MNLIYLDISGKLFLTSSDNFVVYPNSLLGKMFCMENEKLLRSDYTLNNKEVYYFDRDPKIFSHILNFYRNRITYIPEKINKHIFWKELIYWGFEFEKPCYIDDKIWLYIKQTAEKISKYLIEKTLSNFYICSEISETEEFLLRDETKFGDIDICFKNGIYNILTYKWKDINIYNDHKQNNTINYQENTEIQVSGWNNNFDITEFKEEINKELKNIYYRNNIIFNNQFSNIFEKYLEFYLSTQHYLQLKIDFCTLDEYLDSDDYIEKESIYFGINMDYISKQSEKIKIYCAEEITFY